MDIKKTLRKTRVPVFSSFGFLTASVSFVGHLDVSINLSAVFCWSEESRDIGRNVEMTNNENRRSQKARRRDKNTSGCGNLQERACAHTYTKYKLIIYNLNDKIKEYSRKWIYHLHRQPLNNIAEEADNIVGYCNPNFARCPGSAR